MGRRLLALLLTLVAVALAAAPAGAVAAPIEAAYAAPGPSAVATQDVTDGSGAVTYRIFYPADIASGPRRPIVTWGNGSWATPANYPGLLNHLASWGYVVVASTSQTTGKGNEMLAGAQYLVAQDTTPGSPFEGRLDTAAIAAVGHSQGAGGAVNATTHSGGLIKTTVTYALPAPLWVAAPDAFSVAQLTGPAFFVGGQWDVLIASATELRKYYDAAGGPAAIGIINGADHNTIQNAGTPVLGYVTAWLQYQLRGDATARGAFAGPTPELLTNSGWRARATRGLP
ncbi:poly(ethylene terephthalate) hydrolase family protein [Patulibacter defluvii]|uniref:poly(ethylene terephthalate) hydrolase family protein n=1 Tax=Patulibacter defluvii TaxID=3095358 RepID=UPI002A7635D2|nr:alpha/beta hydrolase [Patulibacter sp. DM4]